MLDVEECTKVLQRNKIKRGKAEVQKHEGAGYAQEVVKFILLGIDTLKGGRGLGKAGLEAAEKFAWITVAMLLPAKHGLGPLGNGWEGHGRCSSESEKDDQFGPLAIDLVLQSIYSK